ncbi:MAG: hypothetical protein AAF389_05055 [Gemmatimonadota bacterium]
MKSTTFSAALAGIAFLSAHGCAVAQVEPTSATDDLTIVDARVTHLSEFDVLVFEQRVSGQAGHTMPDARGQMDRAPVLGYVFPTTLRPEDVGFEAGEGVVALAATSHPDFDDTPLWDENGDADPENDGVVFHTHWVVLVPDERVPGGLSVKETTAGNERLPPTNPGMPMYLDSPGFSVVLKDDALRIVVPLDRISHRTDFRFDAVSAYMEVNTSDEGRPMLGVYHVYGVLSGDLSLPYSVTRD